MHLARPSLAAIGVSSHWVEPLATGGSGLAGKLLIHGMGLQFPDKPSPCLSSRLLIHPRQVRVTFVAAMLGKFPR